MKLYFFLKIGAYSLGIAILILMLLLTGILIFQLKKELKKTT